MAFATLSNTIVKTLNDGLNDAAGALTAARWTLINTGGGLPQTTRDIDATGTDIREPTTATLAPSAYFHWYPLANPLTFRASLSVKGANTNGCGAFLTLFRPDAAVANRVVGRVGILAEAGDSVLDRFQMTWRGVATNVAITALANNTYFRVGIEVDAVAAVARGYLNTTTFDSSLGDPGLTLQVTRPIDSGTLAYDDQPVYIGVGLSAAAFSDANYSGTENMLVEEWKIPFIPPSFPTGAFFEVLLDGYSVHKSTLSLHELLNRAKLV